jgi:hypothetical protein
MQVLVITLPRNGTLFYGSTPITNANTYLPEPVNIMYSPNALTYGTDTFKWVVS